jgi:hypothetical protein
LREAQTRYWDERSEPVDEEIRDGGQLLAEKIANFVRGWRRAAQALGTGDSFCSES